MDTVTTVNPSTVAADPTDDATLRQGTHHDRDSLPARHRGDQHRRDGVVQCSRRPVGSSHRRHQTPTGGGRSAPTLANKLAAMQESPLITASWASQCATTAEPKTGVTELQGWFVLWPLPLL
jgi:hypothetical protein